MVRDHAPASGGRGKKEEHKLVMSGPYRWVRHPFYTSFGMDVVAAGLVMANWFVLLLALRCLACWWCARSEKKSYSAYDSETITDAINTASDASYPIIDRPENGF